MNPYIWLGVLIGWLGSLVATGYWQNTAGHTAERVVWQAKANAELARYNAKILQMETDARAKEKHYAAALNVVATNYEKEKSNVLAQKDTTFTALRNGTLQLRDPYTVHSNSGCGAACTATTPTGERDGGTGVQLSVETSEFLVGLTAEADEVVKQLQACQAVVLADRLPDTKGPAP